MIKRIWLTAIACTLILSICDGQNETKKSKPLKPNEPKTSIRVNKEYDKQGNLIRYDSVAVYSYSRCVPAGMAGKDSFMESFFNRSDSLFKTRPPQFDDFFKNEFFKGEFFNFSQIDSIMNRLDSLHNSFLQNHFKSEFRQQKKKK